MTEATPLPGVTARILSVASILACALLGVIALYSSGLGLLDPKLHRAGGFALALIAGVAVSAAMRQRSAEEAGRPVNLLHPLVDAVLILAGLWSIWSFHFVQTEMETALYDVTIFDAWPALADLIRVPRTDCRRLWGWGLFSRSARFGGALPALFGPEPAGDHGAHRLLSEGSRGGTLVQHQQGRFRFDHQHRAQHGLHLHHLRRCCWKAPVPAIRC